MEEGYLAIIFKTISVLTLDYILDLEHKRLISLCAPFDKKCCIGIAIPKLHVAKLSTAKS